MWSICGSSVLPLHNSINEQWLCESIVTQIMTFAAVMMVIMMMIVFACMGWLWRQFRIGGVGALRQIGRETQRWWAKRFSGQNSWQIETNWFCNKAKCQRRNSQAVLRFKGFLFSFDVNSFTLLTYLWLNQLDCKTLRLHLQYSGLSR